MKFIEQLLAKILDKLKAGNPKIWAALAVLATTLQFGAEGSLEAFLATVGLVIDLPAGFLSLDWILDTFKVTVSDKVTDVVMWILVLFTGAKTTASLPEAAREAKIEKTQAKIDAKEQRIAKREMRQAARGL